MWTDKFSPESLDDIPQDLSKLRDFVLNYKKQKKRALLLYGPPGSGKTSAVHVLARELGLELIEVNASDFRNSDAIKSLVGNALGQQSLFSKGKVVLVDEVDGIAGSADRGGISALAGLISSSVFPVVMTANDPWDSRLSSLRSKSVLVEFPAVPITGVMRVLRNIGEAAGVSGELVKSVARMNNGDLRGAIIDFQAAVSDSSLEGIGERRHTESILGALNRIFRSFDASVVVSAFDSLGENLDECLFWIEENLPNAYSHPEDLARAFDVLSRADIFRGRIRRWQYWRYLVYVNVLLTAGIALAKENRVPSFVKLSRNQRFLKRWLINKKLAKRDSVAAKLADVSHCSQKKAVESIPFLKKFFNDSPAIVEALDLTDDEVEWLKK